MPIPIITITKNTLLNYNTNFYFQFQYQSSAFNCKWHQNIFIFTFSDTMMRQFDLMMLTVFYSNGQMVGTFSVDYLQCSSVDFSTMYLKIFSDLILVFILTHQI